jgi:hypothetical protein
MTDDILRNLRDSGYGPSIVRKRPFSFEDLLRSVEPAPDEETEAFVATIYADRRDPQSTRPPE